MSAMSRRMYDMQNCQYIFELFKLRYFIWLQYAQIKSNIEYHYIQMHMSLFVELAKSGFFMKIFLRTLFDIELTILFYLIQIFIRPNAILSIGIENYNSGLFANSVTRKCATCSVVIPNCASCSTNLTAGTTFCATCTLGHYADTTRTACIACPAYCTTCTSSTKCLTCKNSYVMVNSLCVLICSKFKSQCQTCTDTGASIVCDSCMTGYYLQTVAPSNQCNACHTACTNCGPSGCLVCSNGFLLLSPTCISCQVSLNVTGCSLCTNTLCTDCKTSLGYTFNPTTNLCESSGVICQPNEILISSLCQSCSATFDPQCIQCNPTACEICAPGFVYDPPTSKCASACNTDEMFLGGVCQLCASAYNAQCLQCNSTQCTLCTTGYAYNPTSAACQIACAPNEASISGVCQLCSQFYSPECTTCTSVQCTSCLTGYFYDATSLLCEVNPSTPICGDGVWIETVEPCDDGNSINFDGCDSQCQIETDYVCQVTDRLPSGGSLCRFTKDFTISLSTIQKEQSSNVAHAIFTIEPSTFHQWTVEQLEKLMSPVTIIDQRTGNLNQTVIPLNSLSFSFQRVNDQNLVKLIIDYGMNSIEGTSLQFSINPAQTNLYSIQQVPSQPSSFMKLSSFSNGVDFYSYTDETYQFQKSISTISAFLGYASMIFAYLGLMSPVGKLIVVEALVVIQLSFFSILLFRKIPITFTGFRNLIFSNGYNDPNLFESPIIQKDQTIFKLMGLDLCVFLNYNISFIVFFGLPFLFGLVGMVFFLIKRKIVEKERQISADLIEGKNDPNQSKSCNQQKPCANDLKMMIAKRIWLQFTLYGILLTGYLAWISVLSGLQAGNASNYLSFALIGLVWFLYGLALMLTKSSRMNINKNKIKDKEQLNESNRLFTNGFGDFREVLQQITNEDQNLESRLEKNYLIYLFERIIISVVIVHLKSLFGYGSALILAIYVILLVLLIIAQRKLGNHTDEAVKPKICSHLYQNYVLRQIFNFMTVILIQLLFMCQQIMLGDIGNSEDVFSKSEVTLKVIPALIVSLILLNLVINIFLWVWEIKNSQILLKGKQMWEMMFNKEGQDELKGRDILEEEVEKTARRMLSERKENLDPTENIEEYKSASINQNNLVLQMVNEVQGRLKQLGIPKINNQEGANMDVGNATNLQKAYVMKKVWDEI